MQTQQLQFVAPENKWLKKINEQISEGRQIPEILASVIEDAGEYVIGKILSVTDSLSKIEDSIKQITGRVKQLPVDYYFILRFKKDSNFLEVFKLFENQILFLHQTMNVFLKCIYTGELSLYNKNELANVNAVMSNKFYESKAILEQFKNSEKQATSEQHEKKFLEELLSELSELLEPLMKEIYANVEEIQKWFKDCEEIQQKLGGKRHSYASQIWRHKRRHNHHSNKIEKHIHEKDEQIENEEKVAIPAQPISSAQPEIIKKQLEASKLLEDEEEDDESSSEDESDSDSDDESESGVIRANGHHDNDSESTLKEQDHLEDIDNYENDLNSETSGKVLPGSLPSDMSTKEFFRKKRRLNDGSSTNDDESDDEPGQNSSDEENDEEVCSNLSDDSYDERINFSVDGEKKRLSSQLGFKNLRVLSEEKDSEEEYD